MRTKEDINIEKHTYKTLNYRLQFSYIHTSFVSGAQIMLSMKVIGLGFDVSSGVIALPSFTEYLAYLFCAGNVIFGPWISFLDFKSIYSTNVSKCLVSLYNQISNTHG
jgi:hypothetical protein